jgi:hypothetical protein
MLTKTVATIAVVTLVGAGLIAQEPPPQAKPVPAAPRAQQPTPQGRGEQPTPAKAERPREPVGQPVNIRIDITITDQAGPGEPAKKTVTMLLADRSSGSIRSNGTQRIPAEGNFPVSINVDALPTITTEGTIRLGLGLEYQPRPSASQTDPPLNSSRMSQLNERLSIIVQDGKSIMISQAADPGSDRRITVELKASILK